jgi:hypothetical protein
VDRLLADRFSDVSAVYASRSEFVSAMPPHTLFGAHCDISRLIANAQAS